MSASVLALLVLTVPVVAGTASSDVRDLLARVGETYARFSSYDFKIDAHAKFEYDGSTYRFTIPQEAAQGSSPDERLGILQKPFIATKDGSDEPIALPVAVSPPHPDLYDYAQVAKDLQEARFLRNEVLLLGGRRIQCAVVRVVHKPPADSSEYAPIAGPQTLWIDATSLIVLRSALEITTPAHQARRALKVEWRIDVVSYSVNEPPPEWLKQRKSTWDAQAAAARARMEGTAAHDFTLRNAHGRPVSLSQFRGKVVLIDFWGTWCAPCRQELPVVATVEGLWSSKGLVVLRITNEDPEDVHRFGKRTGQSIETLVEGGEVFTQYGVPGIPTIVVIDRNGRIVAYDISVLSESDLTERLRKAGL